MKSLCALSLLTSVLVVHARCPIGTTQGVNADDCYYINPAPTMWLSAERNCLRLHLGDLSSVSSAFENSILRLMISLSSAKEFWLGGSWDTESPLEWTWTDGHPFAYTNWAPGRTL